MRRLIVCLAVVGVAAAFGASPAIAGEGDVKKFCKTNVALDKQFNKDEPNLDKVNDLLDRAAETAPPEIADAVNVAVPAFKENLETAFEDPAVEEAVGQIEQFEYESCGYEQVQVTFEDYAFVGLPDEIEKGTVSFELPNEGTELHEIVFFRLKGDATLDDLLEAEREEFEDLAVSVGGGFAPPGETGYTTLTLKKTGDYAAVCFIPVGATDEESLVAAEEAGAPSHASEGMAAEFEVT
jgi:hypothetical protein